MQEESIPDDDSEEDIDTDNSEEQLIRVKIIPRPTREIKKELEKLVQNGKQKKSQRQIKAYNSRIAKPLLDYLRSQNCEITFLPISCQVFSSLTREQYYYLRMQPYIDQIDDDTPRI